MGNPGWTIERVLSNGLEIDCALCLAYRSFFSSKASIKSGKASRVRCILGLVTPPCVGLLARGCKRRHRFLLIATHTRNLSISPSRRSIEREIRKLYQRRLVLVRPDGHVAWRADEPPADARALIDVVRGASAWANLAELGEAHETAHAARGNR